MKKSRFITMFLQLTATAALLALSGPACLPWGGGDGGSSDQADNALTVTKGEVVTRLGFSLAPTIAKANCDSGDTPCTIIFELEGSVAAGDSSADGQEGQTAALTLEFPADTGKGALAPCTNSKKSKCFKLALLSFPGHEYDHSLLLEGELNLRTLPLKKDPKSRLSFTLSLSFSDNATATGSFSYTKPGEDTGGSTEGAEVGSANLPQQTDTSADDSEPSSTDAASDEPQTEASGSGGKGADDNEGGKTDDGEPEPGIETFGSCGDLGFICRNHCTTAKGRNATFFYPGTHGCEKGTACCAANWGRNDGGWCGKSGGCAK